MYLTERLCANLPEEPTLSWPRALKFDWFRGEIGKFLVRIGRGSFKPVQMWTGGDPHDYSCGTLAFEAKVPLLAIYY
jgi:hypothetical protein